MSRILGAVSDRAIPPALLAAFRGLAETGRTPKDFGCPQPDPKRGHPDGWGIACIGEGEEVYRRGALRATADPAFEEAAKAVGRMANPPFFLLAHVRRSPRRDEIRQDFSHPFRREVSGRLVFFAHDGACEGFGVRNGRTDSMAFFEPSVSTWTPPPWMGMRQLSVVWCATQLCASPQRIQATVSIGVAVYPHHATEVEQLMRLAQSLALPASAVDSEARFVQALGRALAAEGPSLIVVRSAGVGPT